MAISQLDPKTALIVIDLQYGIVRLPSCTPTESVIANAVRLIEAFRAQQLPVVLVNVAGSAPGRVEQSLGGGAVPDDWATLVPELNAQPSDILITKRHWGALINTELHQQLQALAVTQVVVVGIAATIGVESTARQAYELGYNVTLVLDAMTDRSREAFDNSATRIFPKLGETGSTAELLALLGA
ncbi:hydrolase [Shewanella mangrovi]|uniref:Hydrolase n=1 Tax=Shewanella mangrovi TaxID=1515746 RepID=A0A094JLI7_9GAMM|nr:isochorismatase family protein [Shewanella mangrovi]KFZ38909.1 hydrolase [Shewanella mangrovi]